jgi:hypothetical protein
MDQLFQGNSRQAENTGLYNEESMKNRNSFSLIYCLTIRVVE